MIEKILNWCCQSNPNIGFMWLVIVGLLIWVIVLTIMLISSKRFIAKVFGDSGKDDLKGILVEYLQRIGGLQIKVSELDKLLLDLCKTSKQHLSKMGIVRYNPFDDTGGNQSFVLALLDNYDNGVVITGLYNRDQSRIYAKPVKAGKENGFEFSKEEIEAINSAQKMVE